MKIYIIRVIIPLGIVIGSVVLGFGTYYILKLGGL
ncbi:hypothetical protein LCGC14_1944230 [marine sediment metagenome]|uniref:Uncharacterized protein n=1 Tax=marine sediment metagenome TaxID=412755 RepID=A0A0F9FJP1_9ZZZZ